MLLIFATCFLLLLYYLYKRRYEYWEFRGVPTEKSYLFFGSLHDVLSKRIPIFTKVRQLYNKFPTPYFGIYMLNQPSLVIRDPEIIRKVLVKDFNKFVNRKIATNKSVDPLAYHTLFSSKDDTWRNVRAKMTPVFTSGKIKLMLPLMKECGSALNDYFGKCNEEVVELRSIMKKYAVDIISSCAFGINSNCLKNDNSDIFKAATKLLDSKSFIRNLSAFSYQFAPLLVHIFRLTFTDRTSAKYLLNVFDTTMKERREKKIVRNDLIGLLHDLKESDSNYTFDDLTVAAQAISFFLAGNDTTSLTITYTLYELALNTNIQKRLRQEIKENYKTYGDFTYEAIQNMKYLDMVLCETLRKYPLASLLNRVSVSKYTIEETGFTIDKDVTVLVPIAGLHFDPKYFPDPEKFDPERFSDDNKHKIVPYTYLPFGDGPRMCIGQRFATLVSKVALAYLLKDFAFEKTNVTEDPLQFQPGTLFLLSKTGINLKVISD